MEGQGGTPAADAGEQAPSFTIDAKLAGSLTYASFQNAVPVIHSLTVMNGTAESFERCRLEMVSNPPFLRPKTWTLERLPAGESLSLTDRKAELDAAYLKGLNEAERGEVTLRLLAGERLLTECHLPIRLLARDEWGGVVDMAQLLPAFVMPNDPAVARILHAAAEQLHAAGHPSGLDGYQSGDPRRAYLLSAAIYSAVAGLALHYAEPPASFESRGQKVRRPSTIASDRLATCLDSTLLFAATLEAAGLYPLVLLFRGHAAVGVWLVQKTAPSTLVQDAMELRKALASHELLVFETTVVTQRPPLDLDRAQRLLEPRLAEERNGDFVAALDVRRARSGGILPLASHEAESGTEVDPGQAPFVPPLPTPPSLGEMPINAVEEKPTTASGRIGRWQKKLLDLTLRNRLLNFRDTRSTIPFVCPDVAYLEDRLADGASVRLISLPDQNPVGQRDERLYQEMRGQDLQRTFAAEALQRDELASPLPAADLEKRLIDLYRQVRNDFAEGGANTLFLAVGFLRWKQKGGDERLYKAPLLLVPVKLERRSAASRFTLRFHEDEPRFNATLLQLLDRDFELKLPQFAGELPRDDSGIDVPRLLAMMRQAVRDVPGMEVVDETALATFSFAKFLMWKDLVERTDALRENRVVRHLIDTPEQPFADQGEFPDERDLDRRYAPTDIITLLPADSSQIAASVAAAEGRDFVIVGPPGTGKSQTIANMIAHCLAVGKTVLFVAEKTAALNVVHRRLREHGLGDHCLELHSSKTDRKTFFSQLRKSWESRAKFDAAGWIQANERLRLRRDELNAYVDALHRRYENGLTPYGALGLALKARERLAPPLSWSPEDRHDEATRLEMEALAAELGRVFQAVKRTPALELVEPAQWSFAWQESLLAAAKQLRSASEALDEASRSLTVQLGLTEEEPAPLSATANLRGLAKAVVDSAGTDCRIAFDAEFAQRRSQLEELTQALGSYRQAESSLSVTFARDEASRVPVDDLERQWRGASAALWPMSALGLRKVRKLLGSYAGGAAVDPARNLPLLRQMQRSEAAVAASRLAGCGMGPITLDSDPAALERRLALASRLRDAVTRLALSEAVKAALTDRLTPLLDGSAAIEPLRLASSDFVATFDSLLDAAKTFGEQAGQDPLVKDDRVSPKRLAALMRELLEGRSLLKAWATWCETRRRARSRNLGTLVDALEDGQLPPEESGAAFKLAYARWWLPPTLDGNPVLRDFLRFQHEHAIQDFREIDDLVRAASKARVVGVLAHGLPPVQSVARNSELGLLRHQMELKRPSSSIRDMIGAMPRSFSKLAPCMLMSPLSIAQYLPPGHALFDVVVFDEASQITTWDAVGAIARARQTVIVGDPKQLPPTNFFGRNEDEAEDVVEHERDLESILDEAKAAGIPVRDLRWHYRSRSESLIAFSNHHYYQNRLVTFPSPSVEDRAVRLIPVPDGVYDRGKSRTNEIEARALAAEAVARMRAWLDLAEASRPTLGIITFNAQQQALIQDLLDQARRFDERLEWFFADDRIEPTIVKNLENVQGDERDVILFSITFAKDAAGKLSMAFGALNGEGGERRLNVAVTRARQELLVFAGIGADDIDTARTKAKGVHHLKNFLDYANRGSIALPAQDEGSQGEAESPFEEAVAEELERLGWWPVPQVGISGFRIDLGIRHPDFPGRYLAGVECDGATYHSSATARDRDKIREQVLRGLGWSILRVWSTDWWYDPPGCAERLHAELNALLEQSRQQAQRTAAPTTQHWDLGQQIEPDVPTGEKSSAQPSETVAQTGDEEETEEDVAPSLIAGTVAITAAAAPPAYYRRVDFADFPVLPDRFYDDDYLPTLQVMVDTVLASEAPIREDLLAQRIARAHGWLRTGSRIKERVAAALRGVDRTEESSGVFLWRQGSLTEILPYRAAEDGQPGRSVAEIPLAELTSLAIADRSLLDQVDSALALARSMGLDRLAAPSRARLEESLTRARNHLNRTV